MLFINTSYLEVDYLIIFMKFIRCKSILFASLFLETLSILSTKKELHKNPLERLSSVVHLIKDNANYDENDNSSNDDGRLMSGVFEGHISRDKIISKKKLMLPNCGLDVTNIEQCEALGEVLPKFVNLKSLNLFNNGFDKISTDGVLNLFKYISHIPSLSSIDFSYNKLYTQKPHIFGLILELLRRNRKKLTLYFNEIICEFPHEFNVILNSYGFYSYKHRNCFRLKYVSQE